VAQAVKHKDACQLWRDSVLSEGLTISPRRFPPPGSDDETNALLHLPRRRLGA
jgi:hypothetical protein